MTGARATDTTSDRWRRVTAEFLGTAALLAAIVGSGIVASEDGAASAQLFQHAVIVGTALAALILTFGPVSGAHFNPVVTLADATFGGMPWGRAAEYVAAQLAGAAVGTIVTHLTFGMDAVVIATVERSGLGLVGAEVVATAGLIVVIFGLVRSGGGRVVAAAVGAYITAAIYFTASAAFANPAVTLARTLTDTYTGIAPADAPGFLLGQVLGLLGALALVAWLFTPSPREAAAVVLPRSGTPGDLPQPPRSSEPAHPDASSGPSRKSPPPHPSPEVDPMPTSPDPTADVPTVLFLCVHNAGRSQMAAGFLRELGGDRVRVLSAGSEPAEQVNPAAVEAMAERGIDIADAQPQRWTDADLQRTDVVVTMGCGDTCPVLPGKRYLDWELPDPAGKGVVAVRPIRDDIEQRVRGLLVALGVTSDTSS